MALPSLEELMDSLGVNRSEKHIPQQVLELTTEYAFKMHNESGGKAQPATAAILQCIVGAAQPLSGAFDSGTVQQRLLFTLLLTGACSQMQTLEEDSETRADGLAIELSPKNVREAIRLYKLIMDEDITPHLCRGLRKFATEGELVN